MAKVYDLIKKLARAGAMDKAKDNNKGLTKLETGLFDSIEFCLGILGTVPVPIFLVNKDNDTVLLNSARLNDLEKSFCCSHCAPDGESTWKLEVDTPDCIFCQSISEARKKQRKIVRKGIWKVSTGDMKKEFIVLVHAAPVEIEGEEFVFAAIEDLTEVEQLKGLLPICMECNKIYDNNSDDWIRIDEYITDRSPAKFSHGLCPCCSNALMESIDKED